MAKSIETVVYYDPNLGREQGDKEQSARIARMKSVFVRMGIRIRSAGPEQTAESVGYLAGLPGFSGADQPQELPVIPQEMLILRQFTGRRLDQLLLNLRKAGVSRIDLKAVVTEENSSWPLWKLYQELKQEHEKLHEVSND